MKTSGSWWTISKMAYDRYPPPERRSNQPLNYVAASCILRTGGHRLEKPQNAILCNPPVSKQIYC